MNIPCLPANERNKTFDEVSCGFTQKMATEEAKRCLQCKNRPCEKKCPVNVKIPDFIGHIANGDFEKAYSVITETNSLPAICGRVCPQETQCEGSCVRGIKGDAIAIGTLERFAADWYAKNYEELKKDIPARTSEKEKIKVAVVGSGPAGLTCASDLVKYGFDVTVFEAFHKAGGVLTYGIPEFRLPKEIVQREINSLKSLGVKIETNIVIGRTFSVDELLTEFKAVFIGTGAGLPSFLGIDGENYNGVYSANEYLTRINLMKAYEFPKYKTPVYVGKNVAVIGGGNVAMDAARCAKRLGAENVYIVYRRTEEEMPARLAEVHHAKEEGIEFKLLTAPIEILGDENHQVKGLLCSKMELSEPDATGRKSPKTIPDSEFVIDVDCVISAIGQSPNSLILDTTKNLAGNKRGCLVVDEKGLSSIEGVYAGGDAVTGAATVILAMGAGKLAAKSIYEALA